MMNEKQNPSIDGKQIPDILDQDFLTKLKDEYRKDRLYEKFVHKKQSDQATNSNSHIPQQNFYSSEKDLSVKEKHIEKSNQNKKSINSQGANNNSLQSDVLVSKQQNGKIDEDNIPEYLREYALGFSYQDVNKWPENSMQPKKEKIKKKSTSKYPKWVTFVSTIFFCIAAVSITICSLASILSMNADNYFFGYRFYNVSNNSHDLEFLKGSLVFTKNVELKTIQVGEMVTFKSNANTSQLLTLRVSQIEREEEIKFIMINDNSNNSVKIEVKGEDVVGVAAYFIPYGGLVYSFVIKNMVLILILTISLLALGVCIKVLFKKDIQNT